jgi:hypothetical protein
MAEEISRFAYKLIQLDIALARELNRLLWADHTFVADRLMSDLETASRSKQVGRLIKTASTSPTI